MDANGENQQPFSQSQADALNSRPSWSVDMQRVIFTQLFSVTGVPRIMLVPTNTEEYAEYRLGQEIVADERWRLVTRWVLDCL